VLGRADPCHAVTGRVTNDTTNICKKNLFVSCPHHRLVALTDGPQFPVHSEEFLFSFLALGDILPLGNCSYGSLAIGIEKFAEFQRTVLMEPSTF
jgi:hypothetical protein